MKNSSKTFKLPANLIPAQATHPGQLIADEIEFRNIRQKDLAGAMGVAPNFINEIIHGKRNITPPIAFKLEFALGIKAHYWMRLQSNYAMDTYIMQKQKAIERLRRSDSKIMKLLYQSGHREI